ncbi:dodecin family protein [Bradyrhizobium sp. RDM12]
MLDFLRHTGQNNNMPDSVYKVIELVGTSGDSWEKAAANAVEQAAKSLRDLRIAEVVKLDMQLDDKGKWKPIAPSSTYRSSSRAPEPQHLAATCRARRTDWRRRAVPGPPNRTLWPISEVGHSPTGSDML